MRARRGVHVRPELMSGYAEQEFVSGRKIPVLAAGKIREQRTHRRAWQRGPQGVW